LKTTHIVRAAAPFAAILFLTACGHKPTLVGTWNGQIALPGNGGTVPTTLALGPDGTFHKQGGEQAVYSGTYTVKDDRLTETFTSYTVEGHTMTIPADTPNIEMDKFVLKDDTLTITPQDGGPPTVLTRQKT
jgi:hypothetical protein